MMAATCIDQRKMTTGRDGKRPRSTIIKSFEKVTLNRYHITRKRDGCPVPVLFAMARIYGSIAHAHKVRQDAVSQLLVFG